MLLFKVSVAPEPIWILPKPERVVTVVEALSANVAPAAVVKPLDARLAPESKVNVPAETVVTPV